MMFWELNDVDKTLLHALRSEGGFTHPQPPRQGFMVGGVVSERVISGRVTVQDLRSFAWDNRDVLSRPGMFYGAWRNAETGNVHLDVSEYVGDLGEALSLASQREELAIWDIGYEQSIIVKNYIPVV